MQDLQASSTFSQNAFHVMYSRQMVVAYKTFLRFGIDLAYNTLSLDKSKLSFVNQFTDAGPLSGVGGEPLTQLMTFYPTFGAGVALSGASYFFGAALHDMNQPSASFFKGNTANKIPMEININGGYNFLFYTKHGGFEGRPYRAGGIAPAGSVTTAFNFKKQGDARQFDAGVFANYYPMTFGLWYRGLPFISNVPGTINNNDALIFILGVTVDRMRIGYSYDLTISDMFGTSPGSHELTLVYEIPAKPRGSSKSGWTSPPVSCPSF
jgi:type IX secretion system PorP/SprF family membrane protein